MLYLDLLSILSVGLLIGTELCVSAFLNPILWSLDERTQAQAIPVFAARLGRVMPFWYAASFVLLLAEAVERRHDSAGPLLIVSVVIWACVIVATILFLVPINNRLSKEGAMLPYAEMRRQHVRWDKLHRLRVLLLIVSMVCLLVAILL